MLLREGRRLELTPTKWCQTTEGTEGTEGTRHGIARLYWSRATLSRITRRTRRRLTNVGRVTALQTQDTKLDAALTVAPASWHGGVPQWAAPETARLPGRCAI